jgi:hypothetical protein
MIRSESAETDHTPSVCPNSVLRHSPVARSQTLTVLSKEAVMSFPGGMVTVVPEVPCEEEVQVSCRYGRRTLNFCRGLLISYKLVFSPS